MDEKGKVATGVPSIVEHRNSLWKQFRKILSERSALKNSFEQDHMCLFGGTCV